MAPRVSKKRKKKERKKRKRRRNYSQEKGNAALTIKMQSSTFALVSSRTWKQPREYGGKKKWMAIANVLKYVAHLLFFPSTN